MNAVALQGVSIALACRTFQISETCCRYSPVLNDENEEIADWLERLTANKRNWGLRAVFSVSAQRARLWLEPQKGLSIGRQVIAGNHRQADLLRTGTEPAHQAKEAAETGQA